MSVVIAARGLGATIMAADSACDTTDQRFLVDDKLYQPFPWLGLGFVGDSSTCAFARLTTMRMIGEAQPPAEGEDVAAWVQENICESWSQSVPTPEKESMEYHNWGGFDAIVCVRNRVVVVDQNFAAFEDVRGYCAVGVGAGYAMGRLYPFPAGRPWQSLLLNLREAVRATAMMCPGVALPERMITVEH